MFEIVKLTLSPIAKIFFMLLVGVIGAKVKILDEDTTKKLTTVMMSLVSPFLLFNSFLIEYDTQRLKNLGIAMLLAIAVHAVTIAAACLIFRKKEDSPWDVKRVCSVISNCVVLGIPLIQTLLGSEAVLYLSAYIIASSTTNWTFGVMTFSGNTDLNGLKKALTSPCMIAIYLGFIVYVCRIPVPEFVASPVSSIGSCTSAIGLFIAGSNASRADFKSILKNKDTYLVILLRHLILPLITLAAFRLFGLTSLPAKTIFIAVCCPVGSTPSMFATMYGRDGKLAAGLFGLSTILCMVTLPVMMALMTTFLQ